MSAIEEMKQLLDEHGIEWRNDGDFLWHTDLGPDDAVFTSLAICMMTPEEVVDQTLSDGKCNRVFDEDYMVGIHGYCECLRCSECGQPLFSVFNYCPWCGREIVE